MFQKTGVITYAPGTDEDRVMEAALELGAEDIITGEDGSIEVLTTPEDYQTVRDGLKSAGLAPEESEVTQRAETLVELDAETGRQVLKFLDVLEDIDDTQDVWSNADIPSEAYED